MVEILAPAGNLDNLITAVNSGANAVYLGMSDFSARKSSQNFDDDALKYAISYAHAFDCKVYVALNTLVKDCELNEFFNSLSKAYSFGADAFILQDVFLGKIIKENYKNIELHLSTQAGVCNEYGAILAKKFGFSRVILARETDFEDIKKISSIIDTEVFVQGALCTCLSGHCYFSSFIGGNSGNRGFCKQPCRKKYKFYINNKCVKDGYLLSLSDLSIGKYVKKLIEIGVKSFKIEGRMRSSEYVCSSINYYKSIINNFSDNVIEENLKSLKKSFNRGDYTLGLGFNDYKNIISPKIQSHKGLYVGKIIKIFKDELIINTNLSFNALDSFKIIRNGYEIGNAVCVLNGNKKVIKYKGKILVGDEIYITKDVSLINSINNKTLKKNIEVIVKCELNKPLKFISNGIIVESSCLLQKANTKPLTKEDVILNLNKVDKYPYAPTIKFESFCDCAFILKSELNKIRSELYSKLFYRNKPIISFNMGKYNDNSILENNDYSVSVIIDRYFDFKNKVNNIIYFVKDFNNVNFNDIDKYITQNYKVYLYLPAFIKGRDFHLIDKIINKFYGVYGDSYWTIEYAKSKNIKLFAGLGFNIFNKIDYSVLYGFNVNEISVSKELSNKEIFEISKNLNVLSVGNIEIMDLIYCPFNKNCSDCKIKNTFKLVDEGNREFIVSKYKFSNCLFKVYNCADLYNSYDFNKKIFDLCFKSNEYIEKIIFTNYNSINNILINKTSGNTIKGIK